MLIDDILSGTRPDSDRADWFLKQLKEAVVFKVHDVADNIFKNYPEPWQAGEALDECGIFDSIAPPYETLWMEWDHRCDWGFLHDKPCQTPVRLRAGILLTAFDIGQIEDAVANEDGFRQLKAQWPRAKWITSGYLLWEGKHRDGVLSCPPGFVWGADSEGHLLLADGNIPCSPHPLSQSDVLTEEDRRRATGVSWFLCIPFMALSFMNCGNIERIKGPPHPEALQRSRLKKGKLPLFRWHTLVLKGGGKARGAANGHGSGVPNALHLCRGHFKRYAEGKGLFGKLHGTYWWPRHARGSAQEGVVLKDYNIQPNISGQGKSP